MGRERMRENGRFTVYMVLLAIILSSFSITHAGGSSETQATTAQASPPFFDITILDDELVNKSVQSLAFDSVNNRLYVGTMQGLSVVDGERLSISNLTKTDGLAGNNILGLDYDPVGNQIFMGFVDIPYSYPDERLSIFNQSSGLITYIGPSEGLDSGVRCLSYDSSRNWLFIGTDGKGLNILNLTSCIITYRNYSHGLPGNGIVWSLELDEMNNTLYAGTSGGLAIYDIVNDTIDARTTDDGLPDNYLIGTDIDLINHRLYLTAWDLVAIYDMQNDTFTNLQMETSLGDIAIDSINHRVFVDMGDAISMLDAEHLMYISNITEENGLPRASIGSMTWNTEYNTLFVATHSGLAICKLTDIHPPVLNSLPGYDYDGEYVITWQPTANATYYTLQESTDPTFSTSWIVYEGNSTFSGVSDKGDGMYYYRVRASNATSNSPWSNVEHIQVINPPAEPLFNPINLLDADGNYTLSWSNITNAYRYELEESQDVYFTTPIQLYSGLNITFMVFDRPDGLFHYRIRSMNAAGNSSWNITTVLVIHPPGSPAFNQASGMNNTGNFSFSWSAISTADYYELQESNTSDFSSPKLVYKGPAILTSISNKTDGTYYYRIRAVNLGGNSSWSPSLIITVLHPPTIPALSLNETDSNTTLIWTQVQNTDYYVLEIADNPEFIGASVVYNGTGNSYLVNETGTHYYRVKAGNAGGESKWSNVVPVSISPLSSDFLFFIGAGIIIIIITSILIWQKVRKPKLEHSESQNSDNRSAEEIIQGRVKE